MRVLMSVFVVLAFLITGGCAIIEQEATNRGGYFDYVLDRHWMEADSKRMRALRAFAMQVSLARLASVVAKNEEDRRLLAIRIGSLTDRFKPVFYCAFLNDPLEVFNAERKPCFFYDSAMVNYSNGLFDLAKVALPPNESKSLVNAITGGLTNPMDLLDGLLKIARDALIYGRVVGALYRDSIELEVQVWLFTPAADQRYPQYRLPVEAVMPLAAIYAREDDNLEAWISEIAKLRRQGFTPYPDVKFMYELNVLMLYICGLITQDSDALRDCTKTLPLIKNHSSSELVKRALERQGKKGGSGATDGAFSTGS